MNSVRVFAVLFLLTVFLVANWLMDLSENCMRQTGCYLYNGFWKWENSTQLFHASWYLSITCAFFLAMLAVYPKHVGV